MSARYSIGLLNQLSDMLEKVGFTAEDVAILRSRPVLLKNIREVFEGKQDVCFTEIVTNIIDCNVEPSIPKVGWEFTPSSIISHKKQGKLKWDPSKIELRELTKEQKVNWKVKPALSELPALNACVLDYLLVHPRLIPKEWIGKRVEFGGTIYQFFDTPYTRSIVWEGAEWGESWNSICDNNVKEWYVACHS